MASPPNHQRSAQDALRLIPGIHQLSPVTAFDRYPDLFSVLAQRVHPRRVLSFGCSTGEECATIRAYWPTADVFGIDVNDNSLDVARRRFPWARFHHASALPDLGTFDLVFAMSVLCRHGDTTGKEDISAVYPFRMFEEAVGRIVSVLAPHGAIVLHNANYRFQHTSHATAFTKLVHDDFADVAHHARVRKFDPDGRVLADQRNCEVFARTERDRPVNGTSTPAEGLTSGR